MNFKISNVIYFAFILTLSMPHAIKAQNTTRFPGVIDYDEPLELQKNIGNYASGTDEKSPLFIPPQSNKERIITPKIAHFNVVGVTKLDNETLTSILVPYQLWALTNHDLTQLKYDITKAYFDAGYILVNVITPPQDLSDGTIDITVVEGQLGKTIFENTIIHPLTIRGLFNRTNEGDVFHENVIETVMNNINDLKNVKARLRLAPGEAFGSADMNIDLETVDEDIQYIVYNNYGSPLTNRNIFTAGFEQSNMIGFGENIGVRLTYAPNNSIKGGRGHLSLPIPGTDVFLDASYAKNDTNIGGRLSNLDSAGESTEYRLGLNYNFLNTNRRKFIIGVGLEHRHHESFLAGVSETSDKLTKIQATISYLQKWIGRVFYVALGVEQGINAFGSNTKGDSNATRLAGNPDGLIIRPSIVLAQKIGNKGEIFAQARGQISNDILLSSDLFAIGGYGSVRGFDSAVETGENGYNILLEYKHEIYNTDNIRGVIRPFVDMAVVGNRLGNNASNSQLYSAGIGFDLTLNQGAKFDTIGETTMRFDVAKTIGKYSPETNEGLAFYIGLRQEF